MSVADTPFRLPLGIASFESIRRENFVYVDQTRFIALLENRGIRCAVLRRPPRFGKTLFCNTLTAYYDQAAAERFGTNFSGTFISEHPTKYRSQLFVLRFNFAATDPCNAEQTFCDQMRNGFADFFCRYPIKSAADFLTEDHTSPSEYFNAFCNFTQSKVHGKLCLIIDDYDGPIRNALRDAPETLIDADKTHSWFQCFYSAVKTRSDEGFLHFIFITGVLPVPLSSFSDDFSIATDLSQQPTFAALASFSHENAANLVDQVLRHSHYRLTTSQLLQQLEDYCGGYCFSPYAHTTTFDPSQCLYYLAAFCEYGQAPYPLLSPAYRTQLARFVRLLRLGSPAFVSDCCERIADGCPIETVDPAAIRLSSEGQFTPADVTSVLFHGGCLTYDPTVPANLIVPNETLRRALAEAGGFSLNVVAVYRTQAKMADPPHPGRIVKSARETMGLSAETFARKIDEPTPPVTQLLQGETAITPALAEKLSRHISGPDAATWLRMQAAYNDSQPSSHRNSKKDDLCGTLSLPPDGAVDFEPPKLGSNFIRAAKF